MRHGFTLIELSIALVIIGLLIAGVLVGRTLIESSRIHAQVVQFQQFDAGVMTFRVKYRYLPGDAPSFGGDGDGIIDRGPLAPSGDNQINCYVNELRAFWNHLDPVQYATASGPVPNPSQSNKSVPAATVGREKSFVIASAMGLGMNTADVVRKRNYYAILGEPQSTSCFSSTPGSHGALKPVDALALDQKMDNGMANSGAVISGSIRPSHPGPMAFTMLPIPRAVPARVIPSTTAALNARH